MADFVFTDALLRYADDTVGLTTAGGSTGTPHYIMLLKSSGGTSGWTTGISNVEDQAWILVTTTSQSLTHFEVSSSHMGSSGRVFIDQSTASKNTTLNLIEIAATTAVTYTSVSSGAGDIAAAVIFAQIAASDSSGRIPIAAYTCGFPITPNGGDITVNFSTGGWAQFASTS